MSNPSIEKEIIMQLTRLPPEKQEEVLHFVRALTASRPLGVPGKDLVRFAGAIDPDDLQIMTQVIEEDCEKVNPDGW